MRLTQANYYLVIRQLKNTTSRGTVIAGYKTKEQADQDKLDYLKRLPNHNVWVIAREDY